MTSPDPVSASLAVSFGAKLGDYLSGRPGYPPALFEGLMVAGVLSSASQVADLGAGTGLLTLELLKRASSVVAVEPDEDMRAAADRRLGSFAGYRSQAGTAEATGLPDASVDLVVAGQAFHWFDPAETRRETLRILRLGGWAAWIWNERRLEDPLQGELDRLFDAFGRSRRSAFQAMADRPRLEAYFGGSPFEELRLPFEQSLDLSGFVSLAFSRSYMPPRHSLEAVAVERAAEELFERFAENGSVAVRYASVAYFGRPGGEAVAPAGDR